MQQTMKKGMAILLVFAMLFTIMPVSAFAAPEPGNLVVTHNVDQIRELLRQDGDVTIQLDADAEKKITAYSDFEDDKWNSQFVWTKVGSGNKTIDLNGHRLYVYDQSARTLGSLEIEPFKYIQGALLIEIPSGASLTVDDSATGGMIWMDAEMPPKDEIEGDGLLMERNIFAVTGGNLTVNGGEIHAGRSKEIYAQNAPKYDKDYALIIDYTIGDFNFYEHLYGYATWFLSGTAITAESGNVTINGGDIWGRGWDYWSMITRVPGAPNGADDFRTRCAALRVLGSATAHITSGNFYGRSDADAVQVSNPNNLTVNAGSFDVGTNSLLVVPGVEWDGTADNVNDIFFHDSVFEVHEGYAGSFGVPEECIDEQSVKVVKGDVMTLSKNEVDPYRIVDAVNLCINSPLAYKEPSTEVYNVPDGCKVESVTWYENGKIIENPSVTYFKEGDSYYVKIALSVNNDAGTKFKNRLTDVSINGMETELYRADAENIVLTAHFGKCIAALENLEFSAEAPMAGSYASKWIDTTEYEKYYPVGGYSDYGEYRTWYVSDDGIDNWVEMDSEDVFEAGKYYRLSFEVHTGEGQEFAVDSSGISIQPDVTATVNGINAAVSKVYEQDPTEHILVEVDFGKCPAVIQNVLLTVTAPKEGETIKYSVVSDDEGYYAIGDNANNTTYRQWQESDTGYDNWSVMSPGDTFKAGKYYKFVTDIHTRSGYVFSTYDDGISIQPNVAAYVNNYAANVTKGYEQDASQYITVEYFFGICNDSVIENIVVENVIAPVAGEKPTYTYSINGSGYQMNTAKNAYYDAYWKNPPEQWYYIKNGIGWFDMTEWDWVYENETFIPGHEYQVRVYLITDNGYEFAHSKYYEPTVTATVNGKTAEAFTTGSDCTWSQQVQYTFTCAQPEISTIMLYDLDTPQAGKTPDTDVTAAYPDIYVVDSVRWLDVEDGEVDSFEKGQYYTVEITVAAKDYDGVDGCIFADDVTAYIDGKEVNGWYSSRVTTNDDNTVTIRYEFRKPAQAPEIGTYTVTFNANGGTGTMADVTNVYGEYTLPTCNFTAPDGKQFKCWSVNGAEKAAGVTIAVLQDTSVVAVWETVHTHTYATEWSKNATHHWYAATCGHDVVDSKAAHTPDHQGGATEEYAIKCSVCGYEMEAQLNHTHVFDKEVAETKYKATNADCTNAATYYKSCKCGEKGTETFTYGAALGHTASDWKSDNDNHWKECTVKNCGAIVEAKEAHEYDNNNDATCNKCGYEREITGVKKGDVNLDQEVNMDDVVALLNHVVKAEIITNTGALAAGEVTNDADLNMDDVVKLLNYVVKAIDSLD